MLPTDLLIDGYNLIHAMGLGQARYGRGDLQRARQGLLRRLFELLSPEEIARTAVVFDARHPPPHLPPYWFIHGLRVLFAQPHGDADLFLEELISGHSAPRQLTVVSSDHRLHRAAKSRRADAVNCDAFLDFLARRKRRLTPVELPPPKKESAKSEVPAAELAYWLNVFGDVKVSDLVETSLPPKISRRKVAEPSPDEPKAAVRGRKGVKHSTKPPHETDPAESSPLTKASPELFSAAWIDELQRWVDEQQHQSRPKRD